MDYDENDFQSQNLHLAGEGSTKFPPALRPYALPKFDFDDSLHGHLRFDGLVETEVFLGIESNEDNQWIEDFSRGSSGIEFSSSAAESCSISRHNNVWSEATSSESVEMLLKSVGQDEIIPGQNIIKESDACDELGCIIKQMEPTLKHDDSNLSKAADAVDLQPTLLPDEIPGSSSGLKDVVGEQPLAEDTSQTRKDESPVDGNLCDVDPNAVSGKTGGLPVIEGHRFIDGKCDVNQTNIDTLVVESLDSRMQDSSVSEMQVDIMVTSVQNISTSSGELNNQDAQHQINDASDDIVDGLQTEKGERGEECHVSQEAQVDNKNLDGDVVESGTLSLPNPFCSNSKVEFTEEGNAVETSTHNVGEPSNMIPKGDSDLHIMEGSTEGVFLFKDSEIGVNSHEVSPLAVEGDTSFEEHDSNIGAEVSASVVPKMDFMAHITYGQTIFVEKDLLESGCQSDTKIIARESEILLLSGEDDKISKGKGDGSNNIGNVSSLNATCSSAELRRETHATETLEGVYDAFGGCREDSNAEGHVSSTIPAESVVICEENVVSRPSDVQKCDQVSSVHERKSTELHSDNRKMDCEVSESVIMDKEVGAMSFDESRTANDLIVSKLQSDAPAGNESTAVISLENANLISCDPTDDVLLPSGTGVNTDAVIDLQNVQIPVEGFTPLDEEEKTATKISPETTLLNRKTSSQVITERGPVSEPEKVTSCETAGQLLVEQSLSVVDACSTEESQTGLKEALLDKMSQECTKEVEVRHLDTDSSSKSSSKVSDAEHIPKNSDMLTQPVNSTLDESCHDTGQNVKENIEANIVSGDKSFEQIAMPSIDGDAVKTYEGPSSSIPLSESDPKSHALDSGSSCADLDKPTCGSPTVIRANELSQSVSVGVKGSVDQNVPGPEVTDGDANKGWLISLDPKGHDASKCEKNFTFDVSSMADLSEREAGKNWQPFSTIQPSKVSLIVEGSPSTSGLGQLDSRTAQDIFHGSHQVSSRDTARSGPKGTPERRRRASGKTTGKETAKKGNPVKETAIARQSERGDKTSNLSLSPTGICQLVQSNEMHNYGHVECSGIKSFGVLTTSTSSLPDLNTSASSSVVFQQPFTDLQQVQLRAQIFVYGALIQGTVPDEAYMISAFGVPDGGKNSWEAVWRGCMERLHGQKSHLIHPETPLLSHSGARTPDQVIKQGSLQSKVNSTVGRASSKGTPTTIVNPMIPLSSPLWSIPTPCDALQSSGMPRGAVMDYQQALSPLHSLQTPPIRNFVGHNTSWISQAPFRSPWVASPQSSAFDTSARFPVLPITETVQLTPVKEPSMPHSSSVKHVASGPMVQSGSPSVFAGTSPLLDLKKVTVSPGQNSADTKPRKRKKIPVSEDLGQIALHSQTHTESVSAPVTNHLSTSVITTPAGFVSKSTTEKLIMSVSSTTSTDHLKKGDQDAEQRTVLSEETLSKVKDARIQAEDAASLAATAVSHRQEIWNQLDKQKNSGLAVDVETRLASAAVAIAAAAAVAKAAAAAANVASNAALQAKLMADEALVSSGYHNSSQSNGTSLSDGVINQGKATPASILKGEDVAKNSSSIITAAREAARRRVEAASAASKQAENMDAIVKAAELAADAVSQAGKLVAMGDPFRLGELVEAGPEGFWKVPQVPAELVAKSKDMNREQFNVDSGGPDASAGPSNEVPSYKKGTHTNHGKLPTPTEISRESVEDHVRLVDGFSGSVAVSTKDKKGQKSRKASDLAKTIGVVPESEVGSRSPSIIVHAEHEKAVETFKENSIKEGSHVEVFKDGMGFRAAWFSANVLSLKDGKAYVCYNELQSVEGLEKLKEWVALEGEGEEAPKIRVARPITAMPFEGTRKRRRAAMGDYTWSVGDRVDAWIQDSWWEGVISEKSKKDETTLTVHFPAQGETSVVRAWHLRPSLLWKGREWIEWSSSRENDYSSHEGDTPHEKRMRLGGPAAEIKGKDKVSKSVDLVESGKPDGSRLLDISADERIFNIGKSTRDENKPDALRMIRTGLQKEGSRVIFGVPKPGKKRKFMEVSKHYVTDRSSKINEPNDSVKFAKYLMPQGSGSRGWKNTSKIEPKEKRAAVSKPKVLKSEKPQIVSSRTIPQKDNLSSTVVSAPHDGVVMDHMAKIKDSASHVENTSEKHNLLEFRSFSSSEGAAEGPILFSSLAPSSDAPSLKKISTSSAKAERVNKGKLAPAGGKLAKIAEDKVFNGNSAKSTSEVEPRRSNRRIQPTSRLLEGLQSSLIISKIPSVSHDKGHKTQNRSTPRGINHG